MCPLSDILSLPIVLPERNPRTCSPSRNGTPFDRFAKSLPALSDDSLIERRLPPEPLLSSTRLIAGSARPMNRHIKSSARSARV
jgi:hypothetical protein